MSMDTAIWCLTADSSSCGHTHNTLLFGPEGCDAFDPIHSIILRLKQMLQTGEVCASQSVPVAATLNDTADSLASMPTCHL